MDNLRAIASLAGKDLTVWYRRPAMALATLAPSVAYLFVIFFVSFSIGRNPVAIVVDGAGPQASRLVATIIGSDAFAARQMSMADARAALDTMDVSAIVEIPQSFDGAVTSGARAPIIMTVNNVNADEADDLRRSLPAAITSFYGGSVHNPIAIHVAETDLHASDFTLGQFEFLPIVVFLITVSGVISSGLLMSQEWAQGTMKELLSSPVSRWAIVAAKLLSGWVMSIVLMSILIALGAALGLLRLAPAAILPVGLVVLLVALLSTCIGNGIGIFLRHMGAVQAAGVQIAVNMFFLSGGMSVIAFLPAAMQRIGPAIPTYYAVHALDREILYASTAGVVRDIVVLGAVTVAAVGVAMALFQRRTLA